MPFRRSRTAVPDAAVPDAADPVVATRLARVVGPESGVFRLVPTGPEPSVGARFAGEVALPEDADGVDTPRPPVPGPAAGPRVDPPAFPAAGWRADPPAFPGAGPAVGWPADPLAFPGADPRVDPSVVPAAGSAAGRRALAAFDPGRKAVRALGVLALVVALVVGFLVWRSRPRAEPVAATPVAGTSAVAPVSASTAGIVVSVLGRVNRPGLVRLPHGARVADAIEAAGGVLPGTDLGYLNLARKVVDGELLAVGVSPPPAAPGAGPTAGAPAAPGGPVNLNTASVAELDTLPGVGPVLAQRIVDHRTRTGGFRSVEELRKVEGVGDARFEQLKALVTV